MPDEITRTLPDEAIAFLKAGNRVQAVAAIRTRWNCDLKTALDAAQGWRPPNTEGVAC